MISILIPVYNHSVVSLAQSLSLQLAESGIEGEIIIMDDHSQIDYYNENKKAEAFENVVYFYLEQNLGRINIRKKLIQYARFDWLLFIDGDCNIISNHFLKNYIGQLNDRKVVITGGRIYKIKEPEVCALRLHWRYGKFRENIQRHKTAFMTNNFCINKSLIASLSIPIQLATYGHEDTMMGIELKKAGAIMRIIYNPVLHQGLENIDIYLKKTQEAIQNLINLKSIYSENTLSDHVKLYKNYYKIKKWGLSSFLLFLLKKKEQSIVKNLRSCSPSLRYFDLYRMKLLIEFDKEAQANKVS